ncbi:MAG: coiled-coil domain-containing protein [Aureispira sp.]
MKNTIVLYAIAMLMILTAKVAQGQGKGQTQTFNYDYTHNYVVEWKEEDGKLNIKITKGERSDSFTIEKSLDNAIFTTAFKGGFKEVVLEKEAEEKLDNPTFTKVIHQANNVLFYIKAQSLADDDRPKAGDITIAKELEIIKFTEDWRLKCNRVKKYRRTSKQNLDSMPDMLSLVIIPTFFKSMLHLTKTLDDFTKNKATIKYAIQEIKVVLPNLDTNIKKDLDICFLYAGEDVITQDTLDYLNAKFRSYERDYSKRLLDFTTSVDTSSISKVPLAYMKDSLYYRWKASGTKNIRKQYKVHEIKKEREYLLDMDKRKEEWSNLFLIHTQQRLKEKQDSVKQIQDTLNRLKVYLDTINNKYATINSKEKQVQSLTKQLNELTSRMSEDRLQLDSSRIFNRIKKQYELDRKYYNYLLESIEKLEEIKINFWRAEDEFDIAKFKKQKKLVQQRILDVLWVSVDDIDQLSADDFSDPFCRNLESCKKEYKIKLKDIEAELAKNENKYKYFDNATKKQLLSSIKKKQISIADLKQKRSGLDDSIQILKEDPIIEEYCVSNSLEDCTKLLDIKDHIKGKLIKLKGKKKELSKKIKYLETLSQKLEQQKAEIEKESIQQTFIVDSIQLEFYEGLIENIWVRGHLKNDKSTFLKFENRSPIRFSSKKAYDKNSTIWLTASGDEDVYWVLYMGELLTYLQNHDNGTKDFSPANGSIIIKEFDKAIALKKQATFKILEAHVYSDFVGFNTNSPNGLIQTEISKRFNIYTKRYGSFLRKDAVYCRCAGPMYSVNWGFLNFIRPSFVFSKFEDKERLLPAKAYHEIINGQLQSIKYASTKDILQHEIFSVGTVVNIVTLDMPIQKSIIKLNVGYRFGRTELTDSVYQYQDNKISAVADNNYGLNTMRGFIELDYRVTPQKRYGVGTSIRFVYMQSFTDNAEDLYQFNRVNQYSDIDLRANQLNNWMVRFDASGFFKPAKESDNKLFLRYRFHGQLNDLNYNFHQLQVGYSFYLLRNNLNSNKGPK